MPVLSEMLETKTGAEATGDTNQSRLPTASGCHFSLEAETSERRRFLDSTYSSIPWN
jgi:hypothetical protein